MRSIIFVCCFLMCCIAFSQQYIKKFDVIISLSASGTDDKVEKIKSFIASDTAGITYEGYCKSQKCIILKASPLVFSSASAVADYLRLHIGDAVLSSKDYTVKEFYKLCTFASDQEYKYFKTTYR